MNVGLTSSAAWAYCTNRINTVMGFLPQIVFCVSVIALLNALDSRLEPTYSSLCEIRLPLLHRTVFRWATEEINSFVVHELDALPDRDTLLAVVSLDHLWRLEAGREDQVWDRRDRTGRRRRMGEVWSMVKSHPPGSRRMLQLLALSTANMTTETHQWQKSVETMKKVSGSL